LPLRLGAFHCLCSGWLERKSTLYAYDMYYGTILVFGMNRKVGC
jgi:hypothetical protein